MGRKLLVLLAYVRNPFNFSISHLIQAIVHVFIGELTATQVHQVSLGAGSVSHACGGLGALPLNIIMFDRCYCFVIDNHLFFDEFLVILLYNVRLRVLFHSINPESGLWAIIYLRAIFQA